MSLVMKFGGTSLGDAERIGRAAELVRGRLSRAPLVVASAMTGATNDLLRAAALAGEGRSAEAQEVAAALEERHVAAAGRLGGRRAPGLPDELAPYLRARFSETRDRLRGVALLGELTERTRDAVAATGELCSSALLAAAIPEADWLDVRELLATDATHGSAIPDVEAIAVRCRERLAPRLAPGRTVVTQGYIGATEAGVTTTLGRGGSDYSAALLGAAVGSEEIEIWTDVDGMMTADPRVVEGARQIPAVSFDEASELAYFGAKVLHPATIRPAVAGGIPVRVLNTFRPEGSGTLIRGQDAPPADPSAATEAVRAVAIRKAITVVRVTNPRMLMAHGWSAKVFDAFGRHKVSVDLIATSEVSISLTVDDASHLEPVVAELARMAEVAVTPGQAIVAVVGSGLRERPGVAARVFGALADVNVIMISMGASDLNLSFVVAQDQAELAMRRLHAELFEGVGGCR